MHIPSWSLLNSVTPRSVRLRKTLAPVVIGLGLAAIAIGSASAADAYLPIVMPITGFLSVEGGSQRNGAVMALEQAPGGMKVDFPIFDTGTSATGAATALDKALSSQKAIAAAVASRRSFLSSMVVSRPRSSTRRPPIMTLSTAAPFSVNTICVTRSWHGT